MRSEHFPKFINAKELTQEQRDYLLEDIEFTETNKPEDEIDHERFFELFDVSDIEAEETANEDLL
jgi:hypothetical protein